MDTLQAIFPDKPSVLLQTVLDRCGGDVEAAAEFLLGGEAVADLPSTKPAPVGSGAASVDLNINNGDKPNNLEFEAR